MKKVEKNWYAFYTRSRAEKKLYNRLTENEFEAFLPLITRVKQWSDRKKKVREPLIRSYIFVRVGTDEIVEVLKDPAVVGVLKFLGKPAIVYDEEIRNLEILVSASPEEFEVLGNRVLEKGEQVEVVKGSFTGLRGEYIRMKGKYRVIVRIEALGNSISVDIPLSAIKKLAI